MVQYSLLHSFKLMQLFVVPSFSFLHDDSQQIAVGKLLLGIHSLEISWAARSNLPEYPLSTLNAFALASLIARVSLLYQRY
jgi:hypothetical protein